MYTVQDDRKRAQEAAQRTTALAQELKEKYPESDYAARAASIAYKVQQRIPIYGDDRD
jgi:outer membrane protein assembly factor BamD (BamD/ComL family)